MSMNLSDEVYGLLEEQYEEATAEYARSVVEDYDSDFPNLEGRHEEYGLGVAMDQYRNTRAEDGLEAALEDFAQDIEETKQRGVLELLAAEVHNMEI